LTCEIGEKKETVAFDRRKRPRMME